MGELLSLVEASPLIVGLSAVSMGELWAFPFVDATEALSPLDVLGIPF